MQNIKHHLNVIHIFLFFYFATVWPPIGKGLPDRFYGFVISCYVSPHCILSCIIQSLLWMQFPKLHHYISVVEQHEANTH